MGTFLHQNMSDASNTTSSREGKKIAYHLEADSLVDMLSSREHNMKVESTMRDNRDGGVQLWFGRIMEA